MHFADYWSAAEFTGELNRLRARVGGLLTRLNAFGEELAVRGNRIAINQLYYLARLAELENAASVLEKRRPGVAVFHEPFLDLAGFDLDAVAGVPADVISTRGLLVLKREAEETAEVAEVAVASGNGLPGNTHQVYAGTGIYCGAEDPHLDLGAVVDNNINTWFEYERFCGIDLDAMRYREGPAWLTKSREPLELVLRVTFDRRQLVNWLTVDPYLPAERSYVPASLNVLLDDGQGRKQAVGWGQLTGEAFITFTPQYARTAALTFRQTIPYPVTVGIPADRPSLRELGLDFDAATGELKQPVWQKGAAAAEPAGLRERLSGGVARTASALRYQVGLRGVRAGLYRYSSAASYVSRPYTVEGSIVQARLTVGVAAGALLGGQPAVRAYLSVDDGASWLPVRVPGTDGSEPEVYIFGQYVPEAVRQPNAAYLGALRPTAVRVRLDLCRPDTGEEQDPYFSPVVNEYTLEVALAP